MEIEEQAYDQETIESEMYIELEKIYSCKKPIKYHAKQYKVKLNFLKKGNL